MESYLSSILTKKNYKIEFKDIIKKAIEEDKVKESITTKLLIEKNKIVKAKVSSKSEAILCGVEVAKYCFKQVDKNLEIKILKNDGELVKKGDIIMIIEGKASSILGAERIVLNFLQHLSGIATITNKMARIAKKYNVTLLDTRKTLPGLRILEKYAVFVGGGKNHRFNLKDEVLIKENYIDICGGIEKALEKMKGYKRAYEIEVRDIEEFKVALNSGVPYILLDNFKISDMKKAVKLNQGKAKLEASGNVTLKNIKKICKTGVDYVSSGAITHSAKASDFSLSIIE